MPGRVLKIVNLALVSAAVFLAVTIFYQGLEFHLDMATVRDFPPGTARLQALDNTLDPKLNGPARMEDYTVIAARNLFNARAARQQSGNEAIGEPDIRQMKKTRLDLRLWGTIVGTGGRSYAVIENEPGGEHRLYSRGDRVGEACIKAVLRKRVVLDVEGKDRVLEIEGLVEERDDTAARQAGFGSGAGPENQEVRIEVKRERISNVLQDVNNLIRQMRVMPYFENSEPAGVMLSGIQKNSIFEKMGLQSGDIIKRANGIAIRSMDDAMAFYRDLGDAAEIELEIERKGSSRKIHYRIE